MKHKEHNDIIQWATLTDLIPAIEEIAWTEPSYMYLERVPAQWLEGIDIQDGLCLRNFSLATPFNDWERGQIFCPKFELRWEKQQKQFQVVYIGPEIKLSGFQKISEPILAGTRQEFRHYYLWGTRVDDDDLAIVGATNQEQQRAFARLGTPRILYYPVSSQAKQVQLDACEYMDSSGTMIYYRFLQLKELEGDKA